jgi:hypothetical protein
VGRTVLSWATLAWGAVGASSSGVAPAAAAAGSWVRALGATGNVLAARACVGAVARDAPGAELPTGPACGPPGAPEAAVGPASSAGAASAAVFGALLAFRAALGGALDRAPEVAAFAPALVRAVAARPAAGFGRVPVAGPGSAGPATGLGLLLAGAGLGVLLAAPVPGSPAAGFGVAPGAAVLGRAPEAAAPGAAALSAAPSAAVPVRVPAVFGRAPDSAVFARAPGTVLFARVLAVRVLGAFVDLARAVGGSGDAAALGAVEPPPLPGASGASGSAASAPAWPCPAAAFAARVRLPARGWLPVPVGACSAVRLGAGPVPPPAAPAPGIPFSEVTAP